MCAAHGKPKPSIRWLKGNKDVSIQLFDIVTDESTQSKHIILNTYLLVSRLLSSEILFTLKLRTTDSYLVFLVDSSLKMSIPVFPPPPQKKLTMFNIFQ